MQEVYQLLDRIKRLRYYEVIIPLPPLYRFNGCVPFDISIEDETAVCRVLAADIVEAEAKVLEFFNNQV